MRTAPEVGANLAGQFRISALRLLRRLRSEHTPDTPSGVQFSALVCLSRHGGLTPRELGIREEIQKSTVTKLIAALEADGLISRRGDPRDRRRLILELTSAGTELLAARATANQGWLNAHLAQLAEDERAILGAAIPIINKIVGD